MFFSNKAKTVAEIMRPLTDIHAQLDDLHGSSAQNSSIASMRAAEARAEADAHLAVMREAIAAKAKLAALI